MERAFYSPPHHLSNCPQTNTSWRKSWRYQNTRSPARTQTTHIKQLLLSLPYTDIQVCNKTTQDVHPAYSTAQMKPQITTDQNSRSLRSRNTQWCCWESPDGPKGKPGWKRCHKGTGRGVQLAGRGVQAQSMLTSIWDSNRNTWSHHVPKACSQVWKGKFNETSGPAPPSLLPKPFLTPRGPVGVQLQSMFSRSITEQSPSTT